MDQWVGAPASRGRPRLDAVGVGAGTRRRRRISPRVLLDATGEPARVEPTSRETVVTEKPGESDSRARPREERTAGVELARSAAAPSLTFAAFGSNRCAELPPESSETVRAARTIAVSEPASGRLLRDLCMAAAPDSSGVGFEASTSPGAIVMAIAVDAGGRVTVGQVLARTGTGQPESTPTGL